MGTETLPPRVLRYGKDEPPAEQVALRAGPVTALFEEGGLRYIRLGDREILRRVYVAVRDHNWNTILPALANIQIEQGPDSFRVTFDSRHRQGEIDFAWRGTITGDAQGTIGFSMDGEARSSFRRNRIGFCVLHPVAECAGMPYTARKADGSTERGVFPQAISPHQPVMDMLSLSHAVGPGLLAEVRFTGDIFEMEDQRNWTDASYKTYCTPLRLPFPVEVQRGERVAQSVTLTLRGQAPEQPSATGAPVVEIGASPAGPLPEIGLGMASHGEPLTDQEIARLRALNLAHLRVDLDLADPNHAGALRRATREAAALGAALEAAIFLSGDADHELERLVALLDEIRPPMRRWLIFKRGQAVTSPETLALARQRLARHDATIPVGGGTDAYFTELNRDRPDVDALDLVAYSINPQVHAFDNASLVETLAAQAWTVESARQFVGDRPIIISPVTLRPRFNPNATGAETEPIDTLPAAVDERQMSLLGAGWTLGSLKCLAQTGVAAVTYHETTGWRGVMERPAGSPQPERFRSLPGAVFPLYHVLADIGDFAGGAVVPVTTSAPLQVDALALQKDGRRRVLLANLTAETLTVRVRGLPGAVLARHLDERNAVAAMTAPDAFRAEAGERLACAGGVLTLTLLPYGIARLDGELQ